MTVPGAIKLSGVAKSFGAVHAVKPLHLEVRAGEFLTLLGPSGCGKTTLLRLIAGLEGVDRGTILLGDKDITELPPDQRDIAIMFQDYALFPHMSVRRNVEYGLKMRGVPAKARREQALRWLSRLELHHLADRRPSRLSGGQRQRAALARALITDPSALLLDEPLSALDANLRTRLRDELSRIHREVGTTFVCVTHDQDEAMALSDRVVLMRDGLVEQDGAPAHLYDRPANAFVATFFGVCELWPATQSAPGSATIDALGQAVPIVTPEGHVGGPVQVVARPEAFTLSNSGDVFAHATVVGSTLMGAIHRISLTLDGGLRLRVDHPRRDGPPPEQGTRVGLSRSLAALPAVPGTSVR